MTSGCQNPSQNVNHLSMAQLLWNFQNQYLVHPSVWDFVSLTVRVKYEYDLICHHCLFFIASLWSRMVWVLPNIGFSVVQQSQAIFGNHGLGWTKSISLLKSHFWAKYASVQQVACPGSAYDSTSAFALRVQKACLLNCVHRSAKYDCSMSIEIIGTCWNYSVTSRRIDTDSTFESKYLAPQRKTKVIVFGLRINR